MYLSALGSSVKNENRAVNKIESKNKEMLTSSKEKAERFTFF